MDALRSNDGGKKPTNVSISSDLLAQAKQYKINLSATLEAALRERISAKERESWKRRNLATIAAYNQLVEENGTFSAELRGF